MKSFPDSSLLAYEPNGPNSQKAALLGSVLDPVSMHPHRPQPQPVTGQLTIDPDIMLKCRGGGLAIDFYYNSQVSDVTEYGAGRSANIGGYVLSGTSASNVAVVRGSGVRNYYSNFGGNYTPDAATYSPNKLTISAGKITETFPDGNQIVYAETVTGLSPAKLNILRTVDPNGNTTTYNYGTGAEAGLLKTIQVPDGRFISLVYSKGTSTSLLYTLQDWGARVWTYQYDTSSNLTTITQPSGCTTKFGYDGNNRVQYIEDPRGFRSFYSYDGTGRVNTMSVGSAVWSYTYGGNGVFDGSVIRAVVCDLP